MESAKTFIFIFLFSVFTLALAQTDEDLDLDTVMAKRVERLRDFYSDPELAQRLSSDLTANGSWADVDYTTGCDARRADWPAWDHFHNILAMASSWSSSSEETMEISISLALDFWFSQDYTEDDCINAGGIEDLNCPCGTPGLWNTNWWFQMIGIPQLVGATCLLFNSALTPTQSANCTAQTDRSYIRIDGDPNGYRAPMTGANLMDVASIGVSNALLSRNHTRLVEAVGRMWNECQITAGPPTQDGIKVDGAFMQHDGQIYTGNYGKHFMNGIHHTFLETKNTSSPELTPPQSVQEAFLTLWEANEWLIYRKGTTGELSWQYSVTGRMISFKEMDWHGLDLSLDSVLEATSEWDNGETFKGIVSRLRDPDPWKLIGTRYLYTADFLVHRGEGYITTLKMYSNRTTNSECYNDQNPFGFHLSDGNVYTQKSGDEYTDIFGAWDWHSIPGTTVAYEGSQLSCDTIMTMGLHSMVGAVAFGNAGVAVMTHTNPQTFSISFTKTLFFFPGAYAVQFITVTRNNTDADFRTILDQSRANGPVVLDGVQLPEGQFEQETDASTLWHDHVGYTFPRNVRLGVQVAEKVSNWSAIGISVGNETNTIFSAHVKHISINDHPDYIVRLNVNQTEFQASPQGQVQLLELGVGVSSTIRGAVFGEIGSAERMVGLALTAAGNFTTGLTDISWVYSDAAVLILFQRGGSGVTGWQLGVADPTQNLFSVILRMGIDGNLVEEIITLPEHPKAGLTYILQL